MSRYRRWVERLHGGQLVMVLAGWLLVGVPTLRLGWAVMEDNAKNRAGAAQLRSRNEYLKLAGMMEEQANERAPWALAIVLVGCVPVVLAGASLWWWFGARASHRTGTP